MKRKVVTVVLSLFKDIKYIIKSKDGKLYLDVFILESDLGKFKKMLDNQNENIDKKYRKILVERFPMVLKMQKHYILNTFKTIQLVPLIIQMFLAIIFMTTRFILMHQWI